MSSTKEKFQNYITNFFNQNNSDYSKVYNSLSEADKEKLYRYSHFYYYICNPDDKLDKVREELKIVGITSLMEVMMSEVDYKNPFEYFETEHSGKNSIGDYTKFKKDYLLKYGAMRRVKEYFNNYVLAEDVKDVFQNIEVWSKKVNDFKPLKSLDAVAKLLYQMRSDFVHKAKMRGFNVPKVSFSAREIGTEVYKISINISVILKIFEKSFVKYWEEKSKSISDGR